MNDYDAMEAIHKVMDKVYRAEIDQFDALRRIAYIVGSNSADHEATKP